MWHLGTLVPIAKAFTIFKHLSGLTLHPSRCVPVLTSAKCTPQEVAAVRRWLAENIPARINMPIANCGGGLLRCIDNSFVVSNRQNK